MSEETWTFILEDDGDGLAPFAVSPGHVPPWDPLWVYPDAPDELEAHPAYRWDLLSAFFAGTLAGVLLIVLAFLWHR